MKDLPFGAAPIALHSAISPDDAHMLKLPLSIPAFLVRALACSRQRIKDKYNPGAADLEAYKRAAAEGRLAEYWAAQADRLKELTGSSAPPVVAASS